MKCIILFLILKVKCKNLIKMLTIVCVCVCVCMLCACVHSCVNIAYNTVVVQPLTVRGSAQSLGDSVRVTFTANMPATFQCRINNGNFFTCEMSII